jgi:hypothetical protein
MYDAYNDNFSLSSSGFESVSSKELTLFLSGTPLSDVSVSYSVTGTALGDGEDHTLSDGTIIIPAGSWSANFSISDIVDDNIDEDEETIIITLFNPINADLGSYITHTYTIKDNDGNSDPIGAPTIQGTNAISLPLTADTSNLSDADGLGSFSYQWLKNGNEIAGATSSKYTPTQYDANSTVSVNVSYIDGDGKSESVTSPSTAKIRSEFVVNTFATKDQFDSDIVSLGDKYLVSWTSYSHRDGNYERYDVRSQVFDESTANFYTEERTISDSTKQYSSSVAALEHHDEI